jgi:phosphoserine phosphatase
MSQDLPPESRRLEDLAALLEVSRTLGAATKLESLLTLIGESCLHVLDGERSTIFLYDKHRQELYSRVGTGLGEGPGRAAREIRFPADRGIAGEAFRSGKVVNVADAYADPRFNPEVDRKTGFRTRNLLACPLQGLDGEPVGVLQVLNKRVERFTAWDEELIQAFGSQAGVALERQLLQEVLEEQRRVQAELETARSIQQQLLPARPPVLAGFDIAGWNRPAEQTGGDFYDFMPLPNGNLALTLADVTGHGIGPALIAAECRALLRACLALTPQLEEAVPQVNELLTADIPEDRFVTAFVGVVEAAPGQCRYISAGQAPILVFRSGTREITEMPTNGLPLGLVANFKYQPAIAISLAPGDLLVLCTDGFVEWPNPAGECFGNARLFELIQRNHHLAAREMIQVMHRAVVAFAGGVPQQDDLTAVVVKRL